MSIQLLHTAQLLWCTKKCRPPTYYHIQAQDKLVQHPSRVPRHKIYTVSIHYSKKSASKLKWGVSHGECGFCQSWGLLCTKHCTKMCNLSGRHHNKSIFYHFMINSYVLSDWEPLTIYPMSWTFL